MYNVLHLMAQNFVGIFLLSLLYSVPDKCINVKVYYQIYWKLNSFYRMTTKCLAQYCCYSFHSQLYQIEITESDRSCQSMAAGSSFLRLVQQDWKSMPPLMTERILSHYSTTLTEERWVISGKELRSWNN